MARDGTIASGAGGASGSSACAFLWVLRRDRCFDWTAFRFRCKRGSLSLAESLMAKVQDRGGCGVDVSKDAADSGDDDDHFYVLQSRRLACSTGRPMSA